MTYVFVADDFTGASDTLATLARAGFRARLFPVVPDPTQIEGLDAFGIATHARSLTRGDITDLAARIGAALAKLAPRFLHIKVCSTFDSSHETGNMALLAHGLAAATGIQRIAVIGGQPSLGRYAVFGTLFARGPDRAVHRIDRHPVMSCHPVTPMHEADLIRHLGQLGLTGLVRIDRGAVETAPFPRFYDALDQRDVEAAGRSLLAEHEPVIVLGASSVAEAWIANQSERPVSTMRNLERTGPVFAFAGSRSSATTAQIASAKGISRLPIAPGDLAANSPARANALAWVRERLSRGQDCLVYLTAEATATSPATLASASADFVLEALRDLAVAGLTVAGGDTSSAVITALRPENLDYACDLCAGVPILTARVNGLTLPVALKGGQMGGADFFEQAIARLKGQS
ncbi:four-carbon acid sugar kinase family protein [Paracoccus aestuariivivens]|uniref:Four-carbon acid sugar kinase family protein n=1 Tax=Paracoccus aestuariivivens TaxID=1820333 RepID=A0A6L6JC13_9RHOB|nr:four-carbon acid sugar kinase family protein [Paracoccus aestuariivivens]MTH77551.1 four-carbon acid sugar kinase family protein [Paracoccus aestuariivivens]